MMDDEKKLYDKHKDLISSVRKSFDKETDRGVCIMAADLLDNLLKKLLNSKLIGNRKLKKDLFELTGPLGTFSSRINLTYSIGLIHEETFDDLKIIKSIRNKFSHSHLFLDFNTIEIHSEIKKMKSHIYNTKEAKPRNIVTNTVIGVAVAIYQSLTSDKKFESIKKPTFLDNEFKSRVKKDSEIMFKKQG